MKRKRVICPGCKKRIIPKLFAFDYPYVRTEYCSECGYKFSEVIDYETVGPNTSL